MSDGDIQHAACETLGQAESHLRLLDIKLGHWALWPLFRLHCGYELMGLPRGSRLPPSGGLVARLLLADLWRWTRLRPAQLTVITPASSRIEVEDGRHSNLTVDFLDRSFPDSAQLDDINNSAFYRPAHAIRVQPALTLYWPKTLGLLANRTRRPSAQIASLARQLHESIGKFLGDRSPSMGFIAGHVQRFFVEKAWYSRLFRRLRTKTLLVTSYGYHAAVASAREAGIPTLELQHGFVDPDSHFGYAWSDAAIEARSSIPVSDTFLAYGEHWKSDLERVRFWRGRIEVCGNARIDWYRNRRHHAARTPDQPFRLVWASDGICVAESVAFLREFLQAAALSNTPCN